MRNSTVTAFAYSNCFVSFISILVFSSLKLPPKWVGVSASRWDASCNLYKCRDNKPRREARAVASSCSQAALAQAMHLLPIAFQSACCVLWWEWWFVWNKYCCPWGCDLPTFIARAAWKQNARRTHALAAWDCLKQFQDSSFTETAVWHVFEARWSTEFDSLSWVRFRACCWRIDKPCYALLVLTGSKNMHIQ